MRLILNKLNLKTLIILINYYHLINKNYLMRVKFGENIPVIPP